MQMQLILQKNTTAINNVNVKVDGVKGDVAGLTKRVDHHDQRLDYLQDNIADHSTRISVVEDGVKSNTKAIDELKGHIGTQITNIENTITNKINENNVVINKSIDNKITENNTTILNKVDKKY